MFTHDAYAMYANEIFRYNVVTPESQYRQTKRIDRYSRLISRAISNTDYVLEIVLNDFGVNPNDIKLRRIIARYCSDTTICYLHDRQQEQTQILHCLKAAQKKLADAQDTNDDQYNLARLRFRFEYLSNLLYRINISRTDIHNTQTAHEVERFLSLCTKALTRINASIAYLLKYNQRLILGISKQYAHGSIPVMDLVQEGNLGILKAIERFDPSRDIRFTTYAVWWIRRAIVYIIAREGDLMRPPLKKYWECREILGKINRLEASLGHRVTHTEAAKHLSISTTSISAASCILHSTLSLEAPISGNTESSLAEASAIIASTETPDKARQLQDIKKIVEHGLCKLPPRYATILRLRFGIGVYTTYTLEEIAQQQGVTRERIRQLEAKALHMLRKDFNSNDAMTCILLSDDSDHYEQYPNHAYALTTVV